MAADVAPDALSLLVARFHEAGVATPHPELKEAWSERSAIREFDGGFARGTAEHLAVVDVCEQYGASYMAQ